MSAREVHSFHLSAAKAKELLDSHAGRGEWLEAMMGAAVGKPGECDCDWCSQDEEGNNMDCTRCRERFYTASGNTVCPPCRERH